LGLQSPVVPGGAERTGEARGIRHGAGTCSHGTSRGYSAARLTSAHQTKTTLTYEGAGGFQAGTPGGKNLHCGIREHAMGAVLNGLSVSKICGYGSTFFIFSD
jgi:Transketolase, pyrimidine binding domain